MRTEEEVKEFYTQYVYRYAVAISDESHQTADQYLGAAFAYGRTLERSMRQIESDLKSAVQMVESQDNDAA